MKNIPFFSPTALRSLKKEKDREEGGKRDREEKRQKDKQLNDNLFLSTHTGSSKQKLFGKTITKLFIP